MRAPYGRITRHPRGFGSVLDRAERGIHGTRCSPEHDKLACDKAPSSDQAMVIAEVECQKPLITYCSQEADSVPCKISISGRVCLCAATRYDRQVVNIHAVVSG